jgi:hypothetical protein
MLYRYQRSLKKLEVIDIMVSIWLLALAAPFYNLLPFASAGFGGHCHINLTVALRTSAQNPEQIFHTSKNVIHQSKLGDVGLKVDIGIVHFSLVLCDHRTQLVRNVWISFSRDKCPKVLPNNVGDTFCFARAQLPYFVFV